jgi:hypothetical protein
MSDDKVVQAAYDKLAHALAKLAATDTQELQQMTQSGAQTAAAQPAAPQVDPATGMPIDPATGMPVDPATGMPMDPNAAAAPTDPAAAGQQAPPMEDPVIEINNKLDQLLKIVDQTRIMIATMMDASGIQVPTKDVLQAGEDAVKDNAAKTMNTQKQAGLGGIGPSLDDLRLAGVTLPEDAEARDEGVLLTAACITEALDSYAYRR